MSTPITGKQLLQRLAIEPPEITSGVPAAPWGQFLSGLAADLARDVRAALEAPNPRDGLEVLIPALDRTAGWPGLGGALLVAAEVAAWLQARASPPRQPTTAATHSPARSDDHLPPPAVRAQGPEAAFAPPPVEPSQAHPKPYVAHP